MAKVTKEIKITLELTPRECELLWEVLERVRPFQTPDGKHVPHSEYIPYCEDSRYRAISDIRRAVVNVVDGTNDDAEEESISGKIWFNP